MRTADSRHVLYKACKGEKWTVVLNGEEGPEYDRIPDEFRFQPDARAEWLATREGELYRVKHVWAGGLTGQAAQSLG